MLSVEELVDRLIDLSFAEDIGDGDHTTLCCIPDDAMGKSHLLIKEDGILAGVEIAKEVFRRFDPTMQIEVLMGDGTRVKKQALINMKDHFLLLFRSLGRTVGTSPEQTDEDAGHSFMFRDQPIQASSKGAVISRRLGRRGAPCRRSAGWVRKSLLRMRHQKQDVYLGLASGMYMVPCIGRECSIIGFLWKTK